MSCRLCERNTLYEVINFGNQPIVHHLRENIEESVVEYPFRLGSCEFCGFLQLLDPIDAALLYQNYFTLSSWKNQPHVPRLVEVIQSLIGRDHSHSILDIGCNDGTFLDTLKNQGYQNLHGIEPTLDAYEAAMSKHSCIHNTFFSRAIATELFTKAYFNIITTRQVLEHVTDLQDFLAGIHSILKEDGLLVIEVPDSSWNLENLDYALWEEHVNYFTLTTLNLLLKSCGFNLVHHESTLFSGKALILFCQKTSNTSEVKQTNIVDRPFIDRFAESWPVFCNRLNRFLADQNRPILIYGCGSRSSTLINFTDLSTIITGYIDDQSDKQHLFVPGSNLPILPWEEKYRHDHTLLLGVNTENENTVIKKRELIPGNYFSILAPSVLLPAFWKDLIYQ